MKTQTVMSKSAETGYGFSRTIAATVPEAIERVKEALKAEGFGVLSEINLQEKFREKLGVEFREYVILGACNPPIAYQALGEEIGLGLLLPCNVVVYQEGGKAVVAAIDAARMLSIVGNEKLLTSATMVNEKLVRALDSI